MLKGHTTIELTDVNSGKKEVVESDNMFTNAVSEIFQPVFGHMTLWSELSGYIPAYENILGGLLLFDGEIPEDADNYFLPAGILPVGFASYNSVNTGTGTMQGSYNSVESQFDEVNKTMTFVYDFNTAQCNGTIASVCLSHSRSGNGPYGSDITYGGMIAAYPYSAPDPRLVSSGTAYGLDSMSLLTEYLFVVDPDNEAIYYVKIDDSKHLVIVKKTSHFKTISLFSKQYDVIDNIDLDELEIPLGSKIYYQFDYDDDSLYLISANSEMINANETFTVTKVAFGTWNVEQHEIQNLSGSKLVMYGYGSFVSDGYIYSEEETASAQRAVYKINLTNSADITMLSGTKYNQTVFSLARNGIIFASDGRTNPNYGLDIIDTSLNAIRNSGLTRVATVSMGGNAYEGKVIAVRNHPLLIFTVRSSSSGEHFGFLTNYLATINNLSSPVTKTSAQTMKITYTLQEVEDND